MSASLYVSNLASDVTEAELRDLLSRAGVCHSVRIIKHHLTGESRGFALVEMGSIADARNAAQRNTERQLRGQAVRIDVLIERSRRRRTTRGPHAPAGRN